DRSLDDKVDRSIIVSRIRCGYGSSISDDADATVAIRIVVERFGYLCSGEADVLGAERRDLVPKSHVRDHSISPGDQLLDMELDLCGAPTGPYHESVHELLLGDLSNQARCPPRIIYIHAIEGVHFL